MSVYEDGEGYVERIRAGLSLDEAIEAFIRACNRRNTLFPGEKWLDEKLPRIREHLSSVITEDQALALRELALMKAKSGDVIGWLKSGTPSWSGYYEHEQRKKARERHLGFSRAMLPFPWADVDACADNHRLQEQAVSERNGPKTSEVDQPAACAECAGPLAWMFFQSPDWTWEKLCGRAGWLAICRKCRIQADFEMTRMN